MESIHELICLFLIPSIVIIYTVCLFEKEENEIIEIANNIVKYSDKVMDENNLYDVCGSDNMSLYLQYCNKLDSLSNNE